MKKIILVLSVTVIGFTSCKKTSTTPNSTTNTALPETYITYNDGANSYTFKIYVTNTFLSMNNDSIKAYHSPSSSFTTKGDPEISLIMNLPNDSSKLEKMTLGKYYTWKSSLQGDDFGFESPKINNVSKGTRGNIGFYALYNSTESPYINATDVSNSTYFNKINKITYINSTWSDIYEKKLPHYFIEGEYKVKISQQGTSNSKIVSGTYKLKFSSNEFFKS